MASTEGVSQDLAPGSVFARESTGLIREVSALNASIAGASNGPLGEYIVFSIPFALGLFAATSSGAIFWASLIAAVFSIPILINYAVLTSAMPRSGGDYVFTSRIVNPALGFGCNFSLAVWQIVGAGAFSGLVTKTIISPALTILGSILGSHALTTAGTSITHRGWLIVVSVALLGSIGALLCWGTQRALKVNTVLYLVGMISMIVMLLVLLFTPHGSFVAKYNHYAGDPNAYQHVISSATSAGFAKRGTLLMIWPLTAVAMAVFGWYFWLTYFGAEVKQARSWGREVKMMFWPLVVNTFFVLAITAALIHTMGFDFLSSASYLSFVDPSKLAGAAAAGPAVFFTALAAGSKFVAALFIITFIAWGWPLLVAFLVMPIRCVLAWSLDQVFPSSIATVNRRLHTPVVLTVIVTMLAMAVAVIAAYTNRIFQIFAVEIMATALFSQGITGITSIFFPIKMPELYSQQPISRYKLFGIPLLQISGALAVIFTLFWTSSYLHFKTEFGMTGWIEILFIVIFVLGFVVYFVMRTIKERQGLPMRLVFSQIPPE
jgi:amino acid transporter